MTPEATQDTTYFTAATVISAEGARVDPRDPVDRPGEHLTWHREMDLPEELRPL